jgi:hypothetical protein
LESDFPEITFRETNMTLISLCSLIIFNSNKILQP